MTAAAASQQTVLKRLSGGLFFLCLLLVLLALEQSQTVAAWQVARDAVDGLARRLDPPEAAPAPSHVAAAAEVLAGAHAPADDATRTSVGSLTFAAAELRFESGERLRTRPLRIASGADRFAPDETYATRLGVPLTAQIELREVVAPHPSRLCADAPVAAAGLLRRGSRVDLMLFRAPPGPAAPAPTLCGVWSFTAP